MTVAEKNAFITVEEDTSHLPKVTMEAAERRVREENERRWEEACRNAYEYGGRPHYTDKGQWGVIQTDKGKFVAHLIHASGGGCSDVDKSKNYCNLELRYELHAKVIE